MWRAAEVGTIETRKHGTLAQGGRGRRRKLRERGVTAGVASPSPRPKHRRKISRPLFFVLSGLIIGGQTVVLWDGTHTGRLGRLRLQEKKLQRQDKGAGPRDQTWQETGLTSGKVLLIGWTVATDYVLGKCDRQVLC